MIILGIEDISSLESEAGIVATLIKHPDFVFYADDYLLPSYFTNTENKCMYMAIRNLTRKGITTIDPFNIISYLNSSDATKEFANVLSVDKLNEFVDMSDILARHTSEEYRLLVNNVVETAFRRDTYRKLEECQKLCTNKDLKNIEEKIYSTIDEVMTEYSTANVIPQYKDVVEDCWNEIQSRHGDGYAGIPFKFETLNQYATIEAGELFIFAADAKQGKSMMLLNCTVDLLKQGLSVLYIDSELNTRLFTARLIAHLTGIEYRRLVSGGYSDIESEKIKEAIEWLKTRRFTHIYLPMFDQQTIYTAVKRTKHTVGLDVLVIDYFKSNTENSGDAYATYAELGKFTDFVKNRIAGNMNIAAIGACQATAAGKVADSAKIGRNASTIAVITNKTPEEIREDGEECGNKKLKIILNRNGSQHAEGEYIDLMFKGDNILYEEAKQHEPKLPY